MKKTRLSIYLATILGLSIGLAAPARAIPPDPLSQLLFGKSDKDKDKHKKDKHKKDKHDDDDRDRDRNQNHDRDYDHRSDHDRRDYRGYSDVRQHVHHDYDHNGYCDTCGAWLGVNRSTVIVRPQPVIRVYREGSGYDNGRPVEVDVQFALRRAGYYNGPVDGDFGPGTRGAIRAYQYDHDLPVTGGIDRYLLRSLGL